MLNRFSLLALALVAGPALADKGLTEAESRAKDLYLDAYTQKSISPRAAQLKLLAIITTTSPEFEYRRKAEHLLATLSGDHRKAVVERAPVARKPKLKARSQSEPAAGPAARAIEVKKKGGEAIKAGRYAAAIPLLQRALELDPDGQYATHRNLGVAYVRDGQIEPAAEQYRLYIEKFPNARDAAQVREDPADVRRVGLSRVRRLLAVLLAASSCADASEGGAGVPSVTEAAAVAPTPTRTDTENKGRACLQYVPAPAASEGEPADARIRVLLTLPGCLSSSCSEVLVNECAVKRQGRTVRVTSKWSIEHLVDGPCTRDCVQARANCDFAVPPEGSYVLEHAGREYPFVVPLLKKVRICEPDPEARHTTWEPRRSTASAVISAFTGPRRDHRYPRSRREVADVLKSMTPQLQECHQARLDENPRLNGTARFEWTIGQDGKVENVGSLAGRLDDAPLLRCALRAVRTMKFPKSGSPGEVVVTALILFRSEPK